jgi:transcriptional regulator with XRE-family HTH domain
MPLGQKINEILKENKQKNVIPYNQSQLSVKSKVSQPYLSQIINGECKNPSIDKVDRIAVALGTTVTELLE